MRIAASRRQAVRPPGDWLSPRDGARDFPVWFAENRAAPRPTVFIKGNHEDFVWLDKQLEAGRREILPGLTYLPHSDAIDIGDDCDRIRIGGVEFTWRHKDGSVRRRYKSEAEGLAEAIDRTRPRICFFGHHHTRLDAEIAGVRCIGLNQVAMPGNLVAVDVLAREHGYEIRGEWPRREGPSS